MISVLITIFYFWWWCPWRRATFSLISVFNYTKLKNGPTEFYDFDIKLNLFKNNYDLSRYNFNLGLRKKVFF